MGLEIWRGGRAAERASCGGAGGRAKPSERRENEGGASCALARRCAITARRREGYRDVR